MSMICIRGKSLVLPSILVSYLRIFWRSLCTLYRPVLLVWMLSSTPPPSPRYNASAHLLKSLTWPTCGYTVSPQWTGCSLAWIEKIKRRKWGLWCIYMQSKWAWVHVLPFYVLLLFQTGLELVNRVRMRAHYCLQIVSHSIGKRVGYIGNANNLLLNFQSK